MSDGEDGAEKNADTADDNVSDTEEGVATSHDGAGTDDDGLGALVLVRREIYLLLVMCHVKMARVYTYGSR